MELNLRIVIGESVLGYPAGPDPTTATFMRRRWEDQRQRWYLMMTIDIRVAGDPELSIAGCL